MASVRELFATLGMDVDSSGFIKAELAVSAIRNGLQLMGQGLVSAARHMAGVVSGAAQTADRIDELAARTGVSTDALQGLGYAAGFSSVSMDQLALAMNFLAKKGVRDVEGEFFRLADTMAKLPEQGGARAAFAMQHFGRAGGALVPMLKDGGAKLREFVEEARTFGLVMDKDAIARGVEFSDTLDRLRGLATGVGNAIGHELLPTIKEIALGVLGWARANRGLIREKVVAFVTQARLAISDLRTALFMLHRFLRSWLTGLGLLAERFGVLRAVVLPLAALIGGPLLVSVGRAVAGFFALSAAEAAASFWPLLIGAAFLSLIGVLALFAEDVYGYFTGAESVTGDFLQALSELPESVKLFARSLEGLLNPGQVVAAWLPPFVAFFDGLISKATETADTLLGVFSPTRILPPGLRQFLSVAAASGP